MNGFATRIFEFLTAWFAVMALCMNVLAAQEIGCPEQRNARTGALDELTWNRLGSIYQAISEEKYTGARADLQKMLGRTEHDPYLRAIIYQALAYIDSSLEKPGSALGFYEKAINTDALPDPAHYAAMLQAARLQFRQKNYGTALAWLDTWFCSAPPESAAADAHAFRAFILFDQSKYAAALVDMDWAIRLQDEPDAAWYQLKLAAHYELEQYSEVADTLQDMIVIWPSEKTYWTRLSQAYDQLGNTDKSLAVQALAYRSGLLDQQSDIIYLSNLYSRAGVPLKAAEVIESGIENGMVEPTRHHWKMVAEAWYAADEPERSLAAFDAAGKMASDGRVDLRRAYILVELERWQAALDSLNMALEKGGLDERGMGRAALLRGITQFNLGNLDAASTDWARAEQYEPTREAARQWRKFLQGVRRRPAS